MILKDDGKKMAPRELMPDGNYLSRCRAIVDLGTTLQTYGNETKSRHQVWIQWEHPTERMEVEDKEGVKKDVPRASSAFYTLSLYEKANLRKVLDSWRGRAFTEQELGGFELKTVLGAPCMVQTQQVKRKKDGELKDSIVSVTMVPKGVEVAELEGEPIWFSFEDGDTIPEAVMEMKGIARMISESDEYQKANGNQVDENAPDFAKMSAEKATEVEDENLPF